MGTLHPLAPQPTATKPLLSQDSPFHCHGLVLIPADHIHTHNQESRPQGRAKTSANPAINPCACGGLSCRRRFRGSRRIAKHVGQDFARLTRVPGLSARFFLTSFAPNTGNEQKMLRNGAFFIPRESQVARNSGEVPF